MKEKNMYLFSATGHGKGSVDAIGGTVKSTVRKRILSKKESIPLVTSAESFVKVASQLITKTKVVYVPKSKILECANSDTFTATTSIKGISKMHHFVVDNNVLLAWR